MDFSDALKVVKGGDRITRAGWNGKDMWLSMTPGQSIPAEKFWSPHNKEFAVANGGSAEVLPYLTMKTADGKIVPWLASHSDILAEDWKVYVPSATVAAPAGGTRYVKDPGPSRSVKPAGDKPAPAATSQLAAEPGTAGSAKPKPVRRARARSANAGTIAAGKG